MFNTSPGTDRDRLHLGALSGLSDQTGMSLNVPTEAALGV